MYISIDTGKYLSSPAPSEWMEHAACAGTATPEQDPWYPVTEIPETRRDETATALRICATCPVKKECLADAIKSGEQHAIRGGRDFILQPICRLCTQVIDLYTTAVPIPTITTQLGHPLTRLTACLTRHGNHTIAEDIQRETHTNRRAA